jgi:hypothetical protein
MISPLGQRQMFQTINVEAVKTAGETSGLLQREASLREASLKQAMADRMAEEQVSVPEIPKTDPLRTEERKGGQRGQGGQHGSAEPMEPEDEPEAAKPAEGHLDFLA